MIKQGFNVYVNGEHIGFHETKTLAHIEARRWVRSHIVSTHMGEWRRSHEGFTYSTTIGRTYDFVRVKIK